jgi:phage gp46-like protein
LAPSPVATGEGWGEGTPPLNGPASPISNDQSPTADYSFVAGVDIGGEGEQIPEQILRQRNKRKDSTVVTIARITKPAQLLGDPLIEVVQHHWWTGRDHSTQYTALLHLLKTQWHCQSICIDATGVGAGVASWLAKSIPGKVEQVQFTRPLKSDLGYELLAAVNAARLKMYANDHSKEWQEFWSQARLCRQTVSPSAALNFFVDPSHGHDDFVVSLALCVRAATHLRPEPYGVLIQFPPLYNDGPF